MCRQAPSNTESITRFSIEDSHELHAVVVLGDDRGGRGNASHVPHTRKKGAGDLTERQAFDQVRLKLTFRPEQKQLDVHVSFAKVRKEDIVNLPAPTIQAAFPNKNLPVAAPKRCRASEPDSEETAYKPTAKSAASTSQVHRPRRAAADRHFYAELSGSGSEGGSDTEDP